MRATAWLPCASAAAWAPPVFSSAYDRGSPECSPLCLPQTDRVAFGILHPRKSTRGNFHWRDQRFSAERFCFFQIRRDVIYVDVEHRVVIRLMPQRCDMSADAARLGRDHRRRPHRFDLPIEKFLVEFLRLRAVLAANFKMHEIGRAHV